jgi:alkylation response protein AidB-like acyl-CoA dehydrogenase
VARPERETPAAGQVAPGLLDSEANEKGLLARAKEWQAKKADAKWACITWPVEFGGRGASSIQNVIFNQEESKYDVPPNMFGIGQGMLGPTIMAHGTPEQKKRYLEPMLRATRCGASCSASPPRDRTSRACARPPSRTATNG